METTRDSKADAITLLKFLATFFVAWILMLTAAKISKDTGLPVGHLSYLASVGIVWTIVIVSLIKRPATAAIRS